MSEAPIRSSLFDVLLQHRSIRRYRDESIPEEHVQRAVECGQRASTSSNIQAYSLLRVRDDARRRQLVELTGGQAKVAECGAFFIVAGDLRRFMLMTERAGMSFEPNMETFVLAVVDATLFAQNLVVAFESMGYGVCYIGGLRNDLPAVDRLLSLPHGVLPLYGLCVGVPDETPGLKPRLPMETVLFDDAYPSDERVLADIDHYDSICRDYYLKRTGTERDWSTPMARKFSMQAREMLAAYYRSKGASFD